MIDRKPHSAIADLRQQFNRHGWVMMRKAVSVVCEQHRSRASGARGPHRYALHVNRQRTRQSRVTIIAPLPSLPPPPGPLASGHRTLSGITPPPENRHRYDQKNDANPPLRPAEGEHDGGVKDDQRHEALSD